MTYDPLEYADHVMDAMTPALLSDHEDACLACGGDTETRGTQTTCRDCGLTAVQTEAAVSDGATIDGRSLRQLSDRQVERLMRRVGRQDVLTA